MQLLGDKELIRKFEKLSKTDSKKALRKGSRAGAKVVQAALKAAEPRDSGALQQSIKVRALPRSRKWVGHKCPQLYYGRFQQDGTKTKDGRVHIPAQNWMGKAVDSSGDRALQTFVSESAREIEHLACQG